MKNDNSRRSFIKKTAATTAFAMSVSAKSYANIIGANDRVNTAVIGLNGRGQAHISALNSIDRKVSIEALCDVDSRTFKKILGRFPDGNLEKVKTYTDFRKILDKKGIDAITIAVPDHWHTPMAILGLQAGKHVYVEKPVSHNPAEGEMLINSKNKEGKVLLVGNQQRSSESSQQAVKDIAEGIIGDIYYAKAWYSNKRGSIGVGKEVPVPSELDWNLWQGPAPKTAYKDNIVHYNWHWMRNWGTGEVNNNGMHELDVCRWALGVARPDQVISTGGRFQFDDDWEFYDTQKVDYLFGKDKIISWEGFSCNDFKTHGRGRGSLIYGTKGSILLDRNGYWRYDLGGQLISQMDEKGISETTNTVGIGYLDILHMENFIDAIQKGKAVNSSIEEANLSTLMCHYGNISQKLDRRIHIDQETGKIKNDDEAMQFWSRKYDSDWMPRV